MWTGRLPKCCARKAAASKGAMKLAKSVMAGTLASTLRVVTKRTGVERALTLTIRQCSLRAMQQDEEAGLPVRAGLAPTGLYLALRQISRAELHDAFMQETVARVPAQERI